MTSPRIRRLLIGPMEILRSPLAAARWELAFRNPSQGPPATTNGTSGSIRMMCARVEQVARGAGGSDDEETTPLVASAQHHRGVRRRPGGTGNRHYHGLEVSDLAAARGGGRSQEYRAGRYLD